MNGNNIETKMLVIDLRFETVNDQTVNQQFSPLSQRAKDCQMALPGVHKGSDCVTQYYNAANQQLHNVRYLQV